MSNLVVTQKLHIVDVPLNDAPILSEGTVRAIQGIDASIKQLPQLCNPKLPSYLNRFKETTLEGRISLMEEKTSELKNEIDVWEKRSSVAKGIGVALTVSAVAAMIFFVCTFNPSHILAPLPLVSFALAEVGAISGLCVLLRQYFEGRDFDVKERQKILANVSQEMEELKKIRDENKQSFKEAVAFYTPERLQTVVAGLEEMLQNSENSEVARLALEELHKVCQFYAQFRSTEHLQRPI